MKKTEENIKKISNNNPEWLKKIRKKFSSKKSIEKPLSREEILRRFNLRKKINKRLGKYIEALYPDENKSKEDVAFGYLDNNNFIAATDFKEHLSIELGYVSHGLLLVFLGYSEDPSDPKPSHDYRIRGIVKDNMGGDVIFWETPDQLLDKTNFSYLIKCVKELKKRKLIDLTNAIHGSGHEGRTWLGTVKDFIGS